MNTIIYKSTELGSLTDIDEKASLVKGYGSVFGNKDSDGDIIMRGAYRKTLQENGDRVKYLYQHDMDKPLGKMNELYEDDKGLAFVAEVPKTSLGKDVIELMRAGVITENSVGILPIQKDYKDDYRELKEVKLYEISAVTMAANDQAKITSIKSEDDIAKYTDRYDRLIKLIRKGNITDELGYAIEAELLKLKSHFCENITLPNEQFTESKAEEDFGEIFKYLHSKLS